MYEADKEKLRCILIEELRYRPHAAERFVNDLPAIHAELTPALDQWLATREIRDTQVAGLSIRDVMIGRGYNFILALLALNRLLDPDMSAEDVAFRAQSLRKRVPRW